MQYTHKLNKNTYLPLKNIKVSAAFGTVYSQEDGVLFEVKETGEKKEMTNHQIAKLLEVKN